MVRQHVFNFQRNKRCSIWSLLEEDMVILLKSADSKTEKTCIRMWFPFMAVI